MSQYNNQRNPDLRAATTSTSRTTDLHQSETRRLERGTLQQKRKIRLHRIGLMGASHAGLQSYRLSYAHADVRLAPQVGFTASDGDGVV